MLPNDSSVPHDIKRLAERYYYEDRKKGKHNDTALAFVAGSMIFIGAEILFGIWQRSQGRGR